MHTEMRSRRADFSALMAEAKRLEWKPSTREEALDVYRRAFAIGQANPDVVQETRVRFAARKVLAHTVAAANFAVYQKGGNTIKVREDLEAAKPIARYLGPSESDSLQSSINLVAGFESGKHGPDRALIRQFGRPKRNETEAPEEACEPEELPTQMFLLASRGMTPKEVIALAESDSNAARIIMNNPIVGCYRMGDKTIADIIRERAPAAVGPKTKRACPPRPFSIATKD